MWKTLLAGFALCLPAAMVFAASDLDTLKSYVLGTGGPEKEKAVQKLLESKPELAKSSDENGPILMYALDSVDVKGSIGEQAQKLTQMLVAKGADVNGKDKNGMPFLIKYAMFGRALQIEFLLSKGASADVTDADQKTALHWVALLQENGKEGPAKKEFVDLYLRCIEALIKAKANINAKDKNGATALANAAFLGNLHMTTLLLERGADLNAKDATGCSVLGRVLGRQKERWANAKEKGVLPPVIELLKSKGAKEECPNQ